MRSLAVLFALALALPGLLGPTPALSTSLTAAPTVQAQISASVAQVVCPTIPASPQLVSPAPNALSPGQIRLTTTFTSIGVELPFTGDANANAVAGLEFK